MKILILTIPFILLMFSCSKDVLIFDGSMASNNKNILIKGDVAFITESKDNFYRIEFSTNYVKGGLSGFSSSDAVFKIHENKIKVFQAGKGNKGLFFQEQKDGSLLALYPRKLSDETKTFYVFTIKKQKG